MPFTGRYLYTASMDIDAAQEALFEEVGLAPHPPAGVWRSSVPIYAGDRQVGYGTSGAWSPVTKQNLALATLYSEHAATGTELRIEVTVEYERRTVGATVVRTPFFDPPRKKA